MPITVKWDDNKKRDIIYVEFVALWTQDDYRRVAEESAAMMAQSDKAVTVIFDMTLTDSSATNKDSFDSWLAAVKLWRAQPHYAGFWVVVKASYWVRMIIWALSRVYNPTQVEVVSTAAEARRIARKRLKSA
jgi:hypothetical protein